MSEVGNLPIECAERSEELSVGNGSHPQTGGKEWESNPHRTAGSPHRV